MQEAQTLIISDSILKHPEKNAIPTETSKTISKEKEQKIMRSRKIDTLAHRSSST